MPDLPVKMCNHCDGRIIWPLSASTGTPMPLDADPSARGNVLVYPSPGKTPVAAVVTAVQAAGARTGGRPTYLHHAATCPYASRWNRGAAKAGAR